MCRPINSAFCLENKFMITKLRLKQKKIIKAAKIKYIAVFAENTSFSSIYYYIL
jgi:hypothetical protein